MNLLEIFFVFVKGECIDDVVKMLRLVVVKGYDLDRDILLFVLS